MRLKTGLYETLVSEGLAEALSKLDSTQFEILRASLDPGDSHVIFVRHLRDVLTRALKSFAEEERVKRQTDLCNRLLGLLDAELSSDSGDRDPDRITIPAEALLALVERSGSLPGTRSVPDRPAISLATSDLLINARGEPTLGHLLAREFPSADRVDLLCAFIRWNGIRVMEESLRAFLQRGGPMRVLTTTYTGSTERRALDRLRELGAQVKVSYDTQSTRLHAKAWLFRRDTGFSTAYIGSSNLSHSAMIEGREWNVRLSQADAADLLEKFQANFETYWADPGFETYDGTRDRDRFDRAVRAGSASTEIPFLSLDLEPFNHQLEILEKLDVERRLHDRHRNLIVAATGTGKTFVAAFDFKRLRRDIPNPKILYVAHRREILTQSLQAFRLVLREGDFGELYVDGQRPEEGRHVFASIQSLSQLDLEEIVPDFFDVVIVDEFHHAAANTYRRLLDHIRPKELLGLTATPERADGQTILDRFDGRITAEIRIWEALERDLLCPFQYFGIADETDLTHVRWSRQGYDVTELQNLYTADHARVRLILQEIQNKIAEPRQMRALGFCVSIAHARFMADQFSTLGLPALSVSADSLDDERDNALRRLRAREVNVVFAVDLFNEGIDVPEIDTVLFLRPTESATIFLQQLGRGLRRSEGKNCLTVLDFIGKASARFRFDLRYRALTGASRSEVRRQIEEGFPYLPAGCSIRLDRVASGIVLENVSRSIGSSFRSLVSELRSLGRDVTLSEFLAEASVSIAELYRGHGWSWSGLRRAAGLTALSPGPDEETLSSGLRRLIDLDDPEWIGLLTQTFQQAAPREVSGLTERARRILTAFHLGIWGSRGPSNSEESLSRIWTNEAFRQELLELLAVLESSAAHLPIPLDQSFLRNVPLSVHCRYSLDDILAAFGRSTVERPYRVREGIYPDKETRTDNFFVTLAKTAEHYSPTTLYRDYAISPDLFHWESQSIVTEKSPTGQRHIHHARQGVTPLLFVRERRETLGRTLPYMLLGPVSYVSHVGERPMAITWRLKHPMPADFFREAKVAAG